ncbi:MAG: hypothetical protein BMS9Abin37_2985 [Acidobacteriota bacterium]|nr:MAG: hypothetical protein BMS9Abin37_2985 [Acidobacteriota bacterium]
MREDGREIVFADLGTIAVDLDDLPDETSSQCLAKTYEYDFWPLLANHKWPKVLLKDSNSKFCRRAGERRIPMEFGFDPYDIAPDGEHFPLVRGDASASHELHVVLNLVQKLKERVPVE